MCNFFVVPGNGQALLDTTDIEILNILTISCNTVGTEKADKDANTVQTDWLPMVQEVSSTMQMQDQKLVNLKGTEQTQTAI